LGSLLLLALSTAPAEAQKTIRFATTNNLFMAPVFAAIEKGWFDQALSKVGYKLDWHQMNVGPAIAEAMAGDQVDIGQLGVAVAVTAAGRGLPVKILMNTGIAGEGILVRADSGIAKLADLRGKTIAIPAKGNMQDFIIRLGLEKAGLDPSTDVKFLEMDASNQKQALLAKLIDAAVLWEPLSTDIVMNGGRLLASGQQIYPDHQNDTISASSHAIKEHPEAVRAIIETVVRAQQWVIDNPDEAKTITTKYAALPRATIEAAWLNVFRRRDGRPDVKTVTAFADYLYRWGYIKKKLTPQELIDEQFLTTAK